MSWFRFDDHAIDHPKFTALSDGAFRLWIEGGAYCSRHLTDGFISIPALKGFRYNKTTRIQELLTAILWERVDAGYQMHDYLDWNDGREVILTKRKGAKDRKSKWLDRTRSERAES